MATSGVYTLTKTAGQIVGSALRLGGVVSSGSNGTPQQLADGIEALNFILLQYQKFPNFRNMGVQPYRRKTATLTLSSKSAYSLKPSGGDLAIQVPLSIFSALRRTTGSDDFELEAITRHQYDAIPAKSDTGTPTAFLYERDLAEGVLTLDRIPSDTTDTIVLTYARPIQVITSTGDELEVTTEWFRAIKMQLWMDIANEYGFPVTPDLATRAEEALAIANTFEPDTTDEYFQPLKDD